MATYEQPSMPPPSATAAEVRPASQQEVARPTITIAFDPKDYARLQGLTPDGDVAKLAVYTLLMYEAMVEQAEKGFTEMAMRNKETGKGVSFGETVILPTK